MKAEVSPIRDLGLEKTTNRRVYLLPFNTLDSIPTSFPLEGPRFVFLILGDFSDSPQVLGSLAQKLVDAGCAYFCARF
jgi:hypothetical protein